MPKRKSSQPHGLSKRIKQWIEKYDGNYCGSEWSNARAGPSIAAGTVPPVTPLDQACKLHDEELGQQRDPLGADRRFVRRALGAAMTPQSLGGVVKSVVAAAAVGAQSVARQLNFVGDARIPRIASGPKPMLIDPPHIAGEPTLDLFPILKTMPKYARRRRRRGVRKYPKKNRKTFKSKRKVNKRASKYRGRSSRRNRSLGYSKVNNSVLKYEAGGALDDPDAVYLGHGTPTRQLARSCFMAMVRQLLSKYGINFTDWNETIYVLNSTGVPFEMTLYWNYGPQENIAWKGSTIQLQPTDTYYTLADDLLSKFCVDYKAAMDAVDIQYQPEFHKLVLYKGVDEETENFEVASIELKNCRVNYYYSSSLRLQNQTAAGTNGAVTDVNNVNPLEGKVYFGPKGKNYFPLKYKAPEANDTDYKGWVPHVTHGYIRDLAKYHVESLFDDLPSAKDTHASGTKKFALHPGQIVVDRISHRRTVKIATFLKQLQNEWTTPTWHGTNVGTCRVMGFEKLLADRGGTPGPVKVAWEVNYTISCSITHYNVAANAYVKVVPTAV